MNTEDDILAVIHVMVVAILATLVIFKIIEFLLCTP